MKRPRWFLLGSACLLLPLGCSAEAEDEQPGRGVYRVMVTGQLDSLQGAGLEPLPDSIALDWPDEIEIELIDYGDVEAETCRDVGCTYGNAYATVDGAAPFLAFADRDGDAAYLQIAIEDARLAPVDPSDCPLASPWLTELELRLEDGRAQGTGETQLECIVTQEDGPPLHQYHAILRMELSGERVPDPAR